MDFRCQSQSQYLRSMTLVFLAYDSDKDGLLQVNEIETILTKVGANSDNLPSSALTLTEFYQYMKKYKDGMKNLDELVNTDDLDELCAERGIDAENCVLQIVNIEKANKDDSTTTVLLVTLVVFVAIILALLLIICICFSKKQKKAMKEARDCRP